MNESTFLQTFSPLQEKIPSNYKLRDRASDNDEAFFAIIIHILITYLHAQAKDELKFSDEVSEDQKLTDILTKYNLNHLQLEIKQICEMFKTNSAQLESVFYGNDGWKLAQVAPLNDTFKMISQFHKALNNLRYAEKFSRVDSCSPNPYALASLFLGTAIGGIVGFCLGGPPGAALGAFMGGFIAAVASGLIATIVLGYLQCEKNNEISGAVQDIKMAEANFARFYKPSPSPTSGSTSVDYPTTPGFVSPRDIMV